MDNKALSSKKTDSEGINEKIDKRLLDIIELLKEAPQLEKLNNFLDIGMGKGEILKWLSEKGKKCTGTGISFSLYNISSEELINKYGIIAIECDAESMPFQDKNFDGIIMSHVLEHCSNVGNVLKEVRRILSDEGWLFLFVPPHESKICSGHISTGWNIGQLMYVLLLNGFDVKNGKFIHYGYNICAFVQKSKTILPPILGDIGDISLLQKNGLFPLPIISSDGSNNCFFGNIRSINWDPSSEILRKINTVQYSNTNKIFFSFFIIFSNILPKKIRQLLGNILLKGGKILNGEEINNSINPKVLKG